MHTGRAGITLVEQVAALGIMMILGAAVVPHVISSVDRARVNEAAASLQEIVQATTDFNRDVRAANSTKPFPGSLSQLTTAIVGGDAGVTDICGATYSAANAAAWKGPYVNRVVPAGGVPLSIGTAQDAFARVTGGGATLLAIEVTGVTIEHAEALNAAVDGIEAATPEALGSVRWSPAGGDSGGRVTLHYLRPVPAC
jgi:type II secretory pathway pseudopilin PulG